MIETLYERLGIPDTCHLGKRVYKRLFQENADLSPTDKKALREDIATVTWCYTLRPSTILIQVYKDDEREYDEIVVLQVDLKAEKRVFRIAEVVHRSIPYPLLLVFSLGNRVALSLAHKRFSSQTLVPSSLMTFTPQIGSILTIPLNNSNSCF